MKMRTEKGKWIILHNGKKKTFDTALQAVHYWLEMKVFEKQIVLPRSAYPVRSLVPHPKKMRYTKKWREKVERIKKEYMLGVLGE